MNNTDKLLRALIDALGYEAEEERIPLNDFAVSHWNNSGRIGDRPTATIDYKVTKKVKPVSNKSAEERLNEATARMGQQ